MTSQSRDYPTRVRIRFSGKEGWVVLDQIRTIDKIRLKKKLGSLKKAEIIDIKNVIREMLVD